MFVTLILCMSDALVPHKLVFLSLSTGSFSLYLRLSCYRRFDSTFAPHLTVTTCFHPLPCHLLPMTYVFMLSLLPKACHELNFLMLFGKSRNWFLFSFSSLSPCLPGISNFFWSVTSLREDSTGRKVGLDYLLTWLLNNNFIEQWKLCICCLKTDSINPQKALPNLMPGLTLDRPHNQFMKN